MKVPGSARLPSAILGAAILGTTVLATTVLATGAAAEVYIVSPEGPQTIQGAILQSVDGDVIELLDGVFTGSGNRDIFFAGREITVRSASGDPATCIIDCQASETDQHCAFLLEGDETLDSIIEGITIRNGHRGWSGGIFCRYATIRNCRFENNVGTEGGAITMQEEGVIENCWFEGNHALNGGAVSVCCAYGAMASVTGCTFVGNSADNYGGAFRA